MSAAAAAICGTVIWHGADRTAADATRPLTTRGDLPDFKDDGRTFRIGTFNIHAGRGESGEENLAKTASTLRHADLDLAGLYELRGDFDSDQANELCQQLSMTSVFAGTERRWWHDHLGNGLIARLRLHEIIRIPLPGTQSKRFRNALLTGFDAGGTTVRVLAAHVDSDVDRERQLATVFELFRSLQPPVILIGDLNCTTTHPKLAALLNEPDVVDAVTRRSTETVQPRRIDHIIVRGLDIVDATVVETTASDHPLVWAELSVRSAD